LNKMQSDTICAVATARGKGAIALIRLSGPEALTIIEEVFRPISGKKKIKEQKSHTVHFGKIVDADNVIDEICVILYKNPKSYTGEDLVEITCHASGYVQQEIIKLLIFKGARPANPGEFTLRAFLNGKMDLSQAEAVADIIASENKASHKLAVSQMRGGYSEELGKLREKLLHFTSLIELELDFSEEDVEFADRNQVIELCKDIKGRIQKLTNSFSLGNVIKNGIPVAIIGNTNVGKSTLLNALLNEDKAIVTDIPGTTRDIIEDHVNINGVCFRFIDTAGIRKTNDLIETLGIKKTYEKIEASEIILLIIDVTAPMKEIKESIREVKKMKKTGKLIIVVNKIDKIRIEQAKETFSYSNFSELSADDKIVLISAKNKENIEELKNVILGESDYSGINENDVIVTNSRHFAALNEALVSLEKVESGINQGLSGDLISPDLRDVIYHLGTITGQLATDEVLGEIFEHFCIGK